MRSNGASALLAVNALMLGVACGGGGGGGSATQFDVTVTAAGEGAGAVTSTPAGITCGATCSARFDQGARVTLLAVADLGSRFAGWGGACTGTAATCAVTIDADTAITAIFDVLPPQTLAVARAGTGTGAVASTPDGVTCGDTCSAEFTGGSTVTLSAAADEGSKFVGWSGACEGLRNPCTVVMGAAASVTASFSSGGSGLPAPNGGGIAQPSGAAGNLQVLDWAGFAGAVSYTFDDAFPSQVAGDNYAVIHATGVPVTYYVVPSQVALHLDSWEQVLADGNELGNHTRNHCNLDGGALSGCLYGGALPAGATAASQIADTSTYLEETVGASGVWTFASPYGDADWGAAAEAANMLVNRDVDYSGAKTEVLPGDLTKQFHVPSTLFGNQYGGIGDTAEVIEGRIDLARADGAWSVFLFHSLSPVTTPDVSACCTVPAANVAASLDYLNALGDVWGGTVVDIAAYWIGQDLVQNAQRSTSGDVTTLTWELPPGFPPGKYVRVTVDGGTLAQGGDELVWDEHGYYEVALDAGELTLTGP